MNLEPVYAILLGVLLLEEQRELGAGFYAGAAILIGSVVGYAAFVHQGTSLHGPPTGDRTA